MATSTRLQNKINDLYSSYCENFRENKDYLKSISNIAGNRGLSHKERVRRIGNWLDQIGNSLSDSEKFYVDQLLKVNRDYVRKTKGKGNEIKNIYETRLELHNLRREIREGKLEANVEPEITIKQNIQYIPIQEQIDNKPNQTYQKPGFWKKAGNILTYTAIGIAGASIIGLGSFFGGRHYEKKAQQPTINHQQKVIQNLDNKVLSLNENLKKINSGYSSFKSKSEKYKIGMEKTIENTNKSAKEHVDNLLKKYGSLEITNKNLNEKLEKVSGDCETLKIDNEKLKTNNIKLTKNTNEELKVNRRVMLEETNSIGVVSNDRNICNELEIQKQQYLIDKPGDYPKRLDKRCKQLNKNGKHLEDAITRVGWVAAFGNDVLEGPVRFISGLGGGLWGAGSRLIGNKWGGFDNGWKNGDQFGAYVMDGFYGGVTKTEFDGRLLSLDVKGALQIPYCMEDTKLGAHGKLAQVVWWDFIFPFVAHDIFGGGSHGHHKAAFGGGRIDEGPGGNSIISGGGGSIGGVGGR